MARKPLRYAAIGAIVVGAVGATGWIYTGHLNGLIVTAVLIPVTFFMIFTILQVDKSK
mgnify:CR=1 FL=1